MVAPTGRDDATAPSPRRVSLLLGALRREPTELPWRRPRLELLLLGLVALAALSPFYRVSPQDVSRLCLSRSLVEGALTIEPCAQNTIDQAVYDGRTYTDKAPGLSVLAVPAAEAVRLRPPPWSDSRDARLWAVRVLTSGLAFVLLALVVGRVSEGLAPGFGGVALVTFALGTLVAPLAATMFGHVAAAALAFGAFLFAWRRRDVAAGLAAGAAVTVEYQTAAIGCLLAVYVLLRGRRALVRYAAGAVAPLLLLAAYDWAAFGSPLHLSYRYVTNEYTAEQAHGFFGIALPHLGTAREVLIGNRGLLVDSPILLACVAGLVLLARTHPVEATVAGVASAFFFVLNLGYFLPYGGASPGPRFFTPALPFLALGLSVAFARWRAPTTALAAASVAATTATVLTWSETWVDYRNAWRDIPRAITASGRTDLVDQLGSNALMWAGSGRIAAAGIVAASALGALAVATVGARRHAG